MKHCAFFVAATLTAVAFGPSYGQDTTTSVRAFVLEGRVGQAEAVGGTTRALVGPNAVVGVTFGFELSRRASGWVAADYNPKSTSQMYRETDAPAVGLYALTAGVSRLFGIPFLALPWQPLEVGLGVGATQAEVETRAYRSPGTPLPPDAEIEGPSPVELFSSSRWRPTAAARARMALPIGPLRLSATAALHATHIGDVRLWDGGWEPTGDGTAYRATTRVWRYGTVVTLPLTVGLGFSF